MEVLLEMKHRWETTIQIENSKRSCGSKNENSLHTGLCYCSDRAAGDKLQAKTANNYLALCIHWGILLQQ
jgi:hypothetical protein